MNTGLEALAGGVWVLEYGINSVSSGINSVLQRN